MITSLSNFRALKINTLVGNIGGYVGLFLGVSVSQIPELLLKVYRRVMAAFINKI